MVDMLSSVFLSPLVADKMGRPSNGYKQEQNIKQRARRDIFDTLPDPGYFSPLSAESIPETGYSAFFNVGYMQVGHVEVVVVVGLWKGWSAALFSIEGI